MIEYVKWFCEHPEVTWSGLGVTLSIFLLSIFNSIYNLFNKIKSPIKVHSKGHVLYGNSNINLCSENVYIYSFGVNYSRPCCVFKIQGIDDKQIDISSITLKHLNSSIPFLDKNFGNNYIILNRTNRKTGTICNRYDIVYFFDDVFIAGEIVELNFYYCVAGGTNKKYKKKFVIGNTND